MSLLYNNKGLLVVNNWTINYAVHEITMIIEIGSFYMKILFHF